jgi:hypothetical protein
MIEAMHIEIHDDHVVHAFFLLISYPFSYQRMHTTITTSCLFLSCIADKHSRVHIPYILATLGLIYTLAAPEATMIMTLQ